ncbi:MAG: hypothetical protein ACYTG6_17375, partial [Planctomycetota bacterium]
MKKLLAWIPNFWESRLSTLGVALTSVAGCTLVLALAADFVTPGLNVYATAILFLIVPGFFVLGLIL